MIGEVLNDRYRLEAELGQGGMGVVYRAHDTLLDRDVAVKVVSKASLGTEGRARLMHEARAAAQLNHPNIVSVHDAGESDGLPFIVMELVEGATLYQRRPTELDEVVSYVRQICAALEHAHAHGIVHRDLKPENVQIAADGTAKLTDFGLARSVASRMTSEGTIIGTVFYLAPELALGQEYDGRADLYALGVMLYELTTGRLPFAADDPVAVISQHLHAPVVPPRAKNERIPPALDALILRLLSKDPDDRPGSAADVLQALASPAILDREAAPAEGLSVLERIERGRIVGREHELQEARGLWNKALSGQGQLLLISGDPGIGKTRMVRELVTQAKVSGGRAVVGASYAEGGPPYAAFRQILREVLRNGSGDGFDPPEFVLADVLTLVPELRSRYPDVPANPQLDPDAEQQRLLENLLVFFSALADRAPLLLALEDAHWADSGTLFLLRHLARHTRRQRMLTVATYREVELDQARPFHEVLLDLQRERLATRLKLPRLDRRQTRDLLAILFAEEITPEFLDGIYRETEGNPFFIEEVCKALVESGRLYYHDGRWDAPSMEELGIPQSVRVAIQSRVGLLPDDAQQTLHLAAVLGRTFDFDTLASASDQDEDTLIDGLEHAERAQLIEEVHAGEGMTFAFAHSLIPSTLLEGLRTLQRRRLHRRAAAAIETRHPADFEALAHHYGHAGQAEKATTYLLKAGDQARGLYAHQEAINHYQQALEFLREAGDLERAVRTLMKLGLTYHTAFKFEASRQAYEEAFSIGQRAMASQPPVGLPPAPHAFRTVWPHGPRSLDPALAVDTISNEAIEHLFSGLVGWSLEAGVVPDVARSWQVLDGGRRYVFHLRDDVRWSDGLPVTAHDFEYAWKRVLHPATASPTAAYLYVVKGGRAYHQGELSDASRVGVRARDELTLEIQLERPTGHFLQLLRSYSFPVPRHVVEAHGEEWTQLPHLVTNGPFQLEAWQKGEAMCGSRNPAYHGSFAGNVQRVEIRFLPQSAAAMDLYEADELDHLDLSLLSLKQRNRMRQRHAGEYALEPDLLTIAVGFDVHRAPLDDSRVRRALAMATDREMLAHVVLQGYHFPATGGFVPPGMPGHSPGIALPFDPPRARQLLADAGYPGGRGFQGLETITTVGQNPTVEHLQSQWREHLAVEMSWQQVDSAAFWQRIETDQPPLVVGGWAADYPDPDCFLQVGLFWNRYGWQHAGFEELVESARQTMDQGERLHLLQQADKIMVEEAPIVPLTYARGHTLVKPWVRNLYLGSTLRDVIIEPH